MRQLQVAAKSLDARVRSSARGFSAAFSTALVGTWSTRGAFFEAVPRELRTADPTRANDLVDGYIALGDKVVELDGRKLFDIDPPSPSFARSQQSFEWLRHMRAYNPRSSLSAPSAIASRIAREHTLNWIARRRHHPSVAFDPVVAAKRALSLTNQAAFLLDGAEPQDYRAIMAMIMRDTRHAFTNRAQVQDPTDYCFVVIACASVSHALSQHIGTKKLTLDALPQALALAFHPDGGPKTRRPADLALLVPELLSLQALLTVRGLPQPPQLNTVLERSMTMLRMLRHRDGTLARFQGTSSLLTFESDLIATVLSYDTLRMKPPLFAADTGYVRLAAGKSLVLMDCGAPSEATASTQAHASALAFEWSTGNTKIITSAPEIGYTVDADLWEQRTTRAHSTLVAAGLSSAVLASRKPNAILQDGCQVAVQQPSHDNPLRVSARHTGYRQRLGVDHARTLTLSNDGKVLEGEDRLLLRSGELTHNNRTAFALYFQLQPGARVTADGERTLRIKVRHQTVEFETDTGSISIEDPTDRPTYRGPASVLRMVVRSPSAGPAKIKWRFIVV